MEVGQHVRVGDLSQQIARIAFIQMRTEVRKCDSAIRMDVRLPHDFIEPDVASVQVIVSVVAGQLIFNTV